MTERVHVVGRTPLSARAVVELARDRAQLVLDPDPEYRARVRRGADAVRELVARGDTLYGVTSGFGDSCDQSVAPALALELQRNLVRYHGCGTGPALPDDEALAVVAVRLASLARGWSGVREELLEALVGLVRARVVPRIPARGSVGASGDLTPLSYVAAVLCGDREARFEGEELPAAEALARAGLSAIELAPKEGLALMNGTAAMTGMGCMAWARARKLARWASAITAVLVDGLGSNRGHFDARIDALKPHPGHRTCAAWIRADLELDAPEPAHAAARLQDRYSIRCAPHVLGVLLDAADLAERTLDTEINSVNDNPIVDPDRGEFVHGGNFYGGHVALAFDGLKTAIANVAGLLDRQLALVCHPGTNNGLPANLVATKGDARSAHHGFKAMQITASALAAEALKATMPASVFSRSTECHNQDVVSMGTHAVHDALRILELTEETAAIVTLAACQALDVRGDENRHLRARELFAAVRAHVPMLAADRRQDVDIATILALHQAEALPIGTDDGSSSAGSPSARA